jgi:hypothetical protein
MTRNMQLREMYVTEIYICENCGRELKVLRVAGAPEAPAVEGAAAQAANTYMCCGQPMTLKPPEPPAPEAPQPPAA